METSLSLKLAGLGFVGISIRLAATLAGKTLQRFSLRCRYWDFPSVDIYLRGCDLTHSDFLLLREDHSFQDINRENRSYLIFFFRD